MQGAKRLFDPGERSEGSPLVVRQPLFGEIPIKIAIEKPILLQRKIARAIFSLQEPIDENQFHRHLGIRLFLAPIEPRAMGAIVPIVLISGNERKIPLDRPDP
jgi:hypothetical protein